MDYFNNDIINHFSTSTEMIRNSTKETLFYIDVQNKVYSMGETLREFMYCQMFKPDKAVKELETMVKCHRLLIQLRIFLN